MTPDEWWSEVVKTAHAENVCDAFVAWREVERLRRENELLGRGHTGVAAAVAAEYEAKALRAKLALVVETAREVLAQGSLEYRTSHSPRCDCPTCRLYALAAARPEEGNRG